MRGLLHRAGPHLQRSRPGDRLTGFANPFEGYLLLVCVVQGAAVLFGFASPSSILLALGGLLQVVWALLLLVGGGLAFVGLYWPWNPLDAIYIKRVGLLAAAGGTLAYGVALLLLGPIGVVAAIYNLGFCLACLVRARQVTLVLHGVRRELAAIRAAGSAPNQPGGP